MFCLVNRAASGKILCESSICHSFILSNFLAWFPFLGQTQLPSSRSIWTISYVRAKIPLRRKSGPFGAWMGGNGWRVHPFNDGGFSLLPCAQVKRLKPVFSAWFWNWLSWFEGDPPPLCLPLRKQGQISGCGPSALLVGTAAQMMWALCRFHDSLSESTPQTWAPASMQQWFTSTFVDVNDHLCVCFIQKLWKRNYFSRNTTQPLWFWSISEGTGDTRRKKGRILDCQACDTISEKVCFSFCYFQQMFCIIWTKYVYIFQIWGIQTSI